MIDRMKLLRFGVSFIFFCILFISGNVLHANPFPFGVASGDPHSDRVVLWTKLSESKQSARVFYEVSDEEEFQNTVAQGYINTDRERDFTVKVIIAGLDPGKYYYYRFRSDGAYSPVGRTKTLPGEAESFKIAVVTCQHFSAGYFSAYRYIIDDNPDVIVVLGDFIYDFPFFGNIVVREDTVGMSRGLKSYRGKYSLYRTDPHLREALRKFPIIAIWDDHEVMNDYSGKTMKYYNPNRLRGAYRAFMEYLPIEESAGFRIYRKFRIGNLMDLFMIDGRQYRDENTCHPSYDPDEDCLIRAKGQGRTYLGKKQKDWLLREMIGSQARWKVIGNNTMFMDLLIGKKALSVDQWDGFYSEKKELQRTLIQKNIKNIVILTGDAHVFYHGDILYKERKIATELVTAGVTSPSRMKFSEEEILSENEHIKYMNPDYRGYSLIDFRRDHVDVYFYGISSVLIPDGERLLLKKIVIYPEQQR
jgi:alkaline phosphatase D